MTEEAIVSDTSPDSGDIWIDTREDDGGEGPYRTILEIWTAILRPIPVEREKRITPQWAVRIVATYEEIRFSDIPRYRDLFYDKSQLLADILDRHIATDDECLKRLDAEEDGQLNGPLYIAILTEWQKEVLSWELEWNVVDPWAAVELAAIAEVHRMFFDKTGLVSLLDQIDLEFTDDDREALAEELQLMKDAADVG